MTPEQKSVMKQFAEGGHLGLILAEIKLDIASEILSTMPQEHEKRNELYFMTQALDKIDTKIQACLNFETETY